VAGGIRGLEVTLRTANGLPAIRAIAEQVPDAIVGVGTLTQPGEFAASRDAGAVFGVSPGLTKPHLAIAAWEWGKYYDERISTQGLRLEIAPWRRPAPYTAPTASKASGLYMICTMSRQHAEAAGYDDAMMFDWRGRVAEATGANVLFVRDGEIHTPVPDCFLDGITRRTVMDLARKRGINVIEREIWPEELETFEQCFLAGTAVEITPVRSIGPWNFEVGDMIRQLAKDYDDLVNGRLPND